MGIEPGDEVIVPPYTFIATVNVVLRQHAMPIFVDTDPATFQMDARKLDAAITPRTRSIVPVHLGGNVCESLDELDQRLGQACGERSGTSREPGPPAR